VLRVIALAAVPALFILAGAPPCFAGDQDTKQQATTPAQKKPEMKPDAMKSRGFHPAKPSMESAPVGAMPAPPRGDGGAAEDTVGGLPGHSSGHGDGKQP
jgi:hypothetical protein